MPLFDDDRPAPKPKPAPGEPLADLSLHELAERVGLYRDEIARLEAEIRAKEKGRAAADSIFRF